MKITYQNINYDLVMVAYKITVDRMDYTLFQKKLTLGLLDYTRVAKV